jgi:hypothetical protein
MTYASVRSAAEHIARTGKITPQQLAAFSGLDEGLSTAQRQSFTDLWRAEGSPAVPPAYPNTWAGVSAAAKLVGAKYPELVAAQWALESGFGKHVSGRHNYFGLKGKGTTRTTTEFINGARVHVDADFLDFSDLLACVRHLVDKWHLDYKGYKGCNNAASRDAAAKWLVKDGYATDPTYADKLIRLMGEHAPASKPTAATTKPAGLATPTNMVGPRKAPPLKPGDHHLVADDRAEIMTAYSHAGTKLWTIPCLCRGQGKDAEWNTTGSDTPPGLYKVGKVYRDYEQNPTPAFTADRRAYGWYSFDLEGLEGQEGPNSKPRRDGIMIHGGGTACGWPGAWAPNQALHPTLGCIRLRNVDLRDRVLPLIASGGVWVSVLQEAG